MRKSAPAVHPGCATFSFSFSMSNEFANHARMVGVWSLLLPCEVFPRVFPPTHEPREQHFYDFHPPSVSLPPIAPHVAPDHLDRPPERCAAARTVGRRRGGGGRGRPDDKGRHPLGGPIDLRSASARKRKARSRDNESDAKREAVKIREHEESLNKQIFLMQKRQRL